MTARYHVWCVSWDDEEEYGADLVPYDILNHDYTKRVPRGEVHVADTRLYDAASAAEAYADHFYSQRDGYESSWPLVFRVRSPDGTVQDFEVGCEHVPEFSAAPVKVKSTQEPAS
jgi:hypothetical protein